MEKNPHLTQCPVSFLKMWSRRHLTTDLNKNSIWKSLLLYWHKAKQSRIPLACFALFLHLFVSSLLSVLPFNGVFSSILCLACCFLLICWLSLWVRRNGFSYGLQHMNPESLDLNSLKLESYSLNTYWTSAIECARHCKTKMFKTKLIISPLTRAGILLNSYFPLWH